MGGRRGWGEVGGRREGERGEGYSHESWSLCMGRVSLCYSIWTSLRFTRFSGSW